MLEFILFSTAGMKSGVYHAVKYTNIALRLYLSIARIFHDSVRVIQVIDKYHKQRLCNNTISQLSILQRVGKRAFIIAKNNM
jgi:hypothetical protein